MRVSSLIGDIIKKLCARNTDNRIGPYFCTVYQRYPYGSMSPDTIHYGANLNHF